MLFCLWPFFPSSIKFSDDNILLQLVERCPPRLFCIATYQICFSDKKVRRLENRRKVWKPVGRVVIQDLLKEMVFDFIATINLVGGEAIAPLSLQFRRPCVRDLLLSKTLHGQKTFLCIVEEGKKNIYFFFTLPFFSSQSWQDESRHIRMTYLFSIHDHGKYFRLFSSFWQFWQSWERKPKFG